MWRSALRDAAHRPVGGDAVNPASAESARPTMGFTPSSSLRVVRDTRRDALDALEMHVSVYNLPSALTRRTPRVFVALLVEAPPAAKVPTHRGSRTTGASPGASSTPTRAPRDAPTSLAARTGTDRRRVHRARRRADERARHAILRPRARGRPMAR